MEFDKRETITINETKDKYIFWDLDGTLAPYRFNGHVGDPNGTNNGMSLDEINAGIFFERKPSKHMQNVISTCKAKDHIIIRHSHGKKEIGDKNKWFDKYYPNITKRLYPLDSDSKADIIIKYCKENNINLNDVLFVDDIIVYIREAEKKGIESWHISSFLDWNYHL